jgi:hypothetical protein
MNIWSKFCSVFSETYAVHKANAIRADNEHYAQRLASQKDNAVEEVVNQILKRAFVRMKDQISYTKCYLFGFDQLNNDDGLTPMQEKIITRLHELNLGAKVVYYTHANSKGSYLLVSW